MKLTVAVTNTAENTLFEPFTNFTSALGIYKLELGQCLDVCRTLVRKLTGSRKPSGGQVNITPGAGLINRARIIACEISWRS